MSDSLTIAHEARLEAREAHTQISSHEAECARRYEEAAAEVRNLNVKLDELLRAVAEMRGRDEQKKILFGGLPNAVWNFLVMAAMSLATGIAMRIWFPPRP